MAGLLDHLQISLKVEHRYLGAVALAIIVIYGLVILFFSRVQCRTSSSPRIENSTLAFVIEKHLKPGPQNHKLKPFCAEELECLKFFISKYLKVNSFFLAD